MAFNEKTAQRIREILLSKGADFTEKTMFSGICFMVDNKMCCGTHIDKKSSEEFLLCRIGEKAQEKVMGKDQVIPMNFTGRSMKGYIFVVEEGFKSKRELSYWLQLCLDFNPIAKASRK